MNSITKLFTSLNASGTSATVIENNADLVRFCISMSTGACTATVYSGASNIIDLSLDVRLPKSSVETELACYRRLDILQQDVTYVKASLCVGSDGFIAKLSCELPVPSDSLEGVAVVMEGLNRLAQAQTDLRAA